MTLMDDWHKHQVMFGDFWHVGGGGVIASVAVHILPIRELHPFNLLCVIGYTIKVTMGAVI